MPKAAARPNIGTSKRSWLWLQGAACGAIVVLLPGTALLLSTLMALGIATLLMQRELGRSAIRSMLLMSAASALLPLRHLWDLGGTVDAALDILSNPLVPLMSWAATGGAWLINETWFVVAKHIMTQADAREAKRLTTERDELAKEWRGVR